MNKICTSIEQSKKLIDLGIDVNTADMHYWLAWSGGVSEEKRNTPKVGKPRKDAIKTYWCPCWSLAALLDVLPSILFGATPKRKELYLLPDLDKSYCFYRQFAVKTKGKIYLLTEGECLVDACVAMIIKLHELNLL